MYTEVADGTNANALDGIAAIWLRDISKLTECRTFGLKKMKALDGIALSRLLLKPMSIEVSDAGDIVNVPGESVLITLLYKLMIMDWVSGAKRKASGETSAIELLLNSRFIY